MINKIKMAVVAVALAMVMIAVPAMASDESSAAAGPAGEMQLYVMGSGYSWSSETVNAYNAALAVEGSTYFQYGDDLVNYTFTYWYGGVEYTDISPDYGAINTFRGLSDSGSDTWNVFVYNEDYGWIPGESALGWYKPFEDWTVTDGIYQTANVALWYGNSYMAGQAESTLNAYTSNHSPIDLTAITTGSDSPFKHTFYLKDLVGTGSLERSGFKYSPGTGVVVVGYGSDASLALIYAIGEGLGGVVFNNAYDTPVPGFEGYSWMETLMGVGTLDLGNDTWRFWTINTGPASAPVYADFLLGAYSALSNAPLSIATSGSAMTLVYDEVTF